MDGSADAPVLVVVALAGQSAKNSDPRDKAVLRADPPPEPAHAPRRRQKRLNPADVERLAAARKAGAEINGLATEFGIHRATVINHLNHAGVDGRRSQGRTLAPTRSRRPASSMPQAAPLSKWGSGSRSTSATSRRCCHWLASRSAGQVVRRLRREIGPQHPWQHRNRASGVVTSVELGQGVIVNEGAVLYRVNLRPTATLIGSVPSFRTLSLDVEGPDVTQLQAALGRLGLFTGNADGIFRSRTEQAVRRWQQSLGLDSDGVVALGDILFVPMLPARLAPAAPLMVGASVAGGEELIEVLAPMPSFEIQVTADQALLIPANARVLVDSGVGTTWNALAGGRREDLEAGTTVIELAGVNGAPVCAETCDQVPLAGVANYRSQVEIVARTEGVVIPLAGIQTDAAGQTFVRDVAGSRVDIRVIARAEGIAVIEGLAKGTNIRLPREAQIRAPR